MKFRRCIVIGLAMLAFVGLTGSCNRRPEKVLDEDKMVDLMVDMQLAEAYYTTHNGPTDRMDKEALTASVLKKHGVTQEELDSTIVYYGKNIDDYYRLFAKVEEKLKGRTQSGRHAEEVQQIEDDIWPYGPFTMVMANQATDGIIFSMPVANLTPGIKLEWKMRLTTPDGVEGMLGVEYENGISALKKQNAGSTPAFSIPLQTDTAQRIKRVFGVLTVPDGIKPLWVDSIRLVKTDFDSLEYYAIRQQKSIYRPVPKPVATADSIADSIADEGQ